MIEQRQLFIDHVGAVSAAAAQVDDRIGPPRVMQRRVEARNPAVIDARSSDALRRRVAQDDPQWRTMVTLGRCEALGDEFMPAPFGRVDGR